MGPRPVSWPWHHQASRPRRDHSTIRLPTASRRSGSASRWWGGVGAAPLRRACGAFGLLRSPCSPPLPLVPWPPLPWARVPGLPHRRRARGAGEASPPHQGGIGTWATMVRQYKGSAPAAWRAGPGEGPSMATSYLSQSLWGCLGCGRQTGVLVGLVHAPLRMSPLDPGCGCLAPCRRPSPGLRLTQGARGIATDRFASAAGLASVTGHWFLVTKAAAEEPARRGPCRVERWALRRTPPREPAKWPG